MINYHIDTSSRDQKIEERIPMECPTDQLHCNSQATNLDQSCWKICSILLLKKKVHTMKDRQGNMDGKVSIELLSINYYTFYVAGWLLDASCT